MKVPLSPLYAFRQRAFTLVELIVSMLVLTLLLVMVTQMMNSAIVLSANSTRRLDADSQARLALDRMSLDFSQIVKRQDVDYYLQKNAVGSNDQMAFYSETSGYFPSDINTSLPKSNAALVGYRVSKNHLERLNKALVWNGVKVDQPTSPTGTQAMMFLPQTLRQLWPSIVNDSADPDYQIIGEQVFRMEICYLVRNASTDAKLSGTPYLPLVTGAARPLAGAPGPAVSPYNGLRDVVAFVVSLAVLDDASRTIVKPADLQAAASILHDVDDNSLNDNKSTPAKLWQDQINGGDLIAKMPKTAASQVRVYERYFYLGNAQ